MAKLIRIAENDWRNGMFKPSNGASMALRSALPRRGEQNDEREFDRNIKRLLRIAPPAHRRAVKSRAQNDHTNMQPESPRDPMLRPGSNRIHFTPQEHADFAGVDGFVGQHKQFRETALT